MSNRSEPRTRKSGVELLDQLEAYVHAFKAWPADKSLELREVIRELDQYREALEHLASAAEIQKQRHPRQQINAPFVLRIAREALERSE